MIQMCLHEFFTLIMEESRSTIALMFMLTERNTRVIVTNNYMITHNTPPIQSTSQLPWRDRLRNQFYNQSKVQFQAR
jgi:hypothetical protein